MSCAESEKWYEVLASIDKGMVALSSGVKTVTVDGTATTFADPSALLEYREYADKQYQKSRGRTKGFSTINIRSAW